AGLPGRDCRPPTAAGCGSRARPLRGLAWVHSGLRAGRTRTGISIWTLQAWEISRGGNALSPEPAPRINPRAVRTFKHERRNFGLEGFARAGAHLVSAAHEARCRRQRTAACVFELLAGPKDRLRPDNANALHFLHAALSVGDV